MRRREFWLLVTPSVIVMFGFMLVPLYRTVRWSFEKVEYGTPGTSVGLANYTGALTDPRLGRAVLFTLGLTVVVTAFCLVFGYILASLVNQLRRARPLVLGLLLVPYVLPHVVGGVAFSWLFDTNFGGIFNYVVNGITGGALGDPLWFTDAWPNRVIVALNVVWYMLPFAMLMILAGLQGVSTETLEAAEIDGASPLQRHLYVIVPSIRGVLGFVLLIFTMDVLRVFDSLIPLSPQAVTLGNESIMLYIYNVAFREGAVNLGLGSAISVLTIVLILVLLYPSIRNLVREARAA
ncbi:carbohydrate ABC transporter permease [Microlunatus flavus]|uniref:Multiple sugar transport system permease protein/N,N'-diacetylchitobiose transport system permease protein n=1 Tax=Microlunatus flavus TaxID=1036181 RepID=A0A1H9C5V7_9ACTN|nr:sugar ABC transporter permease [Microlunatus flavus]SEP96512.1 multiple sugar transport system permease protein/N,N'-diacetylchitobiose transport system permease protein [Microlunatus flavus]